MEVVSGIASVAQLAAYSHVASQRLVQLYKAVQEGPELCRTQRFNISFLLDSIQRICICISKAPEIDIILPLLISTANLANTLLNLLQPQGALYNRWLWIVRGQEIENTFRALNDKARLLQLHITERTYNIVANVQKDIQTMSQNNNEVTSKESQPHSSSNSVTLTTSKWTCDSQTTQHGETLRLPTDIAQHRHREGRLELTANKNQSKGNGIQQVANGWGSVATSSARVEASENKKEEGANQFVAEKGEVQRSGSSCSEV